MNKFLKISILFFGLIIASTTQAASDESAVNITYTIPQTSCQGCDGPGGPTDSSNLAISDVSSTVDVNSTTVSWVASSNFVITQRSFSYGLSTNYGETVELSKDEINLQNLVRDTDYFFKITVVDSMNKLVEYTGTFHTAVVTLPTPLMISQIEIIPGIRQAELTFEISEDAAAQVDFARLDDSFAAVVLSETQSTEKSFQLADLLANTNYHLKITVTTEDGRTTSTPYLNFKTLPEGVVPPNVTNALFQTRGGQVYLSWKNPLQSVSPNFVGVRIVRNSRAAANVGDGQMVKQTSAESFVDSDVVRGGTYYYTIFSYDNSGHFSSGVVVYGTIPLVSQVENCVNGADDDSDGRIDCADSDCVSEDSCQTVIPGTGEGENCSNSLDDDGDGAIDCVDLDCVSDIVCSGGFDGIEICGNNLDDDNNGLIDCLDGACIGFPACVGEPPTTTVSRRECADGIDNDDNGSIDWPDDSGCENVEDDSEYSPPVQNISEAEDIDLVDLEFYSGQGTLRVMPVAEKVIGLSGYDLALIWRPKNGQEIASVQFRLGSDSMNVFFDEIDDYYTVKFSFPAGEKAAYFQINYRSGEIDTVNFKVVGNSWGKVTARENPVANGEVLLYRGSGELFDAEKFSQSNPKLTGKDGFYGWMIPNGKYYVVVKHPGYFDYRSPTLDVVNGYWSKDVKLIGKTKSILEAIKSGDGLIKNIGNVGRAVLENISVAARMVKQMVDVYADNPVVEKVTRNIIAPATVGVVAAVAVPAMSLPGVIAILRFVFFQPLMLIGRRRRQKWGMVYNSLDKMPIDLAIVRLVDSVSGKVVQSRVTDQKGRYYFVAKPGRYRIEISKEKFVFPTVLLSDMKTDAEKVDLYHGEEVEVSEDNVVITANIPVDPVGVTEKPRRIAREMVLRTTRMVISLVGILASAVAVYILPIWQMWTLLIIQIVMGLLFTRLSRPLPVRGWGVVYDASGKKPLANVVARLFNSKFNKMVTSQVTDSHGRYYLMAADDLYFATFDKQNYSSTKIGDIDMRGKADSVVTVDVSMDPQ